MILVTVFQPVIGNIPQSGVGKIAFQLFEKLLAKEKVEILFSRKGNLLSPNVKELGPIFELLFRVVGKFHYFMPFYIIRFLQEVIYDIFVFMNMPKQLRILFTTNLWMPLSVKKAKNIGAKVISIAGNPCDNYIVKLLTEEKQRLQIKGRDAFDYAPRIKKYNRTIGNIDIIICVNEYIASSFKPFLKSNQSLVTINKIFDANYDIIRQNKLLSESEFIFFYCAYSTTLKGLHYLLKAFEELSKTFNTIKLYIGGVIEKKYFNAIKDLLNNTNIILLGQLTSSQISEQLLRSNVFVCPSLTDAGPVTIIEAMFSKTPVICSDGVGHKWLIQNGKNGYVYSKSELASLVRTMKLVIEDKERLKVMGDNAHKTIIELINRKDEFYNEIVSILEY